MMAMQFHDGSSYRLVQDEDNETEMHLDRKIAGSQDQWENVEVTGIESHDLDLEDAIIFLVKIALRDTRC
jgi:hypothetical protein